MTQCASLAGDAAAGDGSDDVNLLDHLGQDQGLTGDELQGIQAEIIVDVAAVDGDLAGAAFVQTNASDGGLAAASAIQVRLLALIPDSFPSLYYSMTMGF